MKPKQELLDEAIRLLIKRVNPVVIYLFGSAAIGELRKDSDIDIAYLSDKGLPYYDNYVLAQQLADVFKRDVDLINLKDASTVFKALIVGKGRRIYCNDEKERMCFEMKTFKEYARLNEERSVVLKGIEERGSIYG